MFNSELMQHIGVESAKASLTQRQDFLRLMRCTGMLLLLSMYLILYQISIWSTLGFKFIMPGTVSDFQASVGSGFWMLGLYLLELNNVKVIVTGDKLEIEHSMIISNHRSFIDYFVFPYLSILLIQQHELEELGREDKKDCQKKEKPTTKKIIRNQFENEYVIAKDYDSLLMPNVMYFTWYNIWKAPNLGLFHRVLMSDENWELNSDIQYNIFSSYKKESIKNVCEWLVLFPEVNIFTESSSKLENSMAEKYYLPVFKNLLYPRFSNFANAIGGLQKSQFSRLYDVSILYRRTPEKVLMNEEQDYHGYGDADENSDVITDEFRAPNLFEIFGLYKGQFTVYLNIRAKMLNRVPLKRNRLEKWLEKRWRKKDKLIESMKLELKKGSK